MGNRRVNLTIMLVGPLALLLVTANPSSIAKENDLTPRAYLPLVLNQSTMPHPTVTPTNTATPTRTPTRTAAPTATSTAQPTSTPSGQPTPVGQSGNWNMIFSDEFSGTSLNTSIWRTCFLWLSQNNCTLSDNNELELYQPDDVYLDGAGNLVLRAQTRTVNGYNYTSGMVTAKASSAFQYGYAEARVKIPSGQGLWPAFWMLPADDSWPPEIDVMEILGQDPTTAYLTYHWSSGGHQQSQGSYTGPNFSAGWHTFAVDWGSNAIIWYVDGVERYRFTNASAITNKSMYVLLNLAVGGWPGPPSTSTHFPAEFSIDYVRVWQKAAGSTSTLAATSIPTQRPPPNARRKLD